MVPDLDVAALVLVGGALGAQLHLQFLLFTLSLLIWQSKQENHSASLSRVHTGRPLGTIHTDVF